MRLCECGALRTTTSSTLRNSPSAARMAQRTATSGGPLCAGGWTPSANTMSPTPITTGVVGGGVGHWRRRVPPFDMWVDCPIWDLLCVSAPV
eukprot:3041855-Prymnesium_polylepis.1